MAKLKLHAMAFTDLKARRWLRRYLRFVDYMGLAQLYLKDNYFLEEPLKAEHIKERILGHWGTVPGLNFIYAQLNYLIWKHSCEMLFIVGPGHGAPAVLANLYAEGTLGEHYKEYSLNEKGFGNLVHDFSWPHTPFPSHVTPSVPGSILEGGELGYSLATAYGAVMDNPDLIATVVVGDGESETGPIATAWHSNKFLNPKTSGAVLPIVHINGYKISNPTIYGRMADEELEALFEGYGYDPYIISGKNIEKQMMKALESAYQTIRDIQARARKSDEDYLEPIWPVILLRTPKGWRGLEEAHDHPIEGSFHSHGVPLGKPKTDEEELALLEEWLLSYQIDKLVDEDGKMLPVVSKYLPKGKLRMGQNKHAVGGNVLKELKTPNMKALEVSVKEGRGCHSASSMETAGEFYRELIKLNKKNFRMFCPDEMMSNKLHAVFDVTGRAFMWPTEDNDEHIDPEGRVMEMLSEHTLQGWYMGYLLTGRHGVFVSYEAFTTIISSMVDQYAKFLKQALKIDFRKPVSSAVYLESSVGWRQDHNGFSHQNPSFVSNVLQKHGEFCQIYYPPDANSMLASLEEVAKKKDSICVIVAGKRKLPQWLTLKEAHEQAKKGIGLWEWVTNKKDAAKPDVVLASAGDYLTNEALSAVQLCKELVPEMKIRYVNISELTSLCLGDYYPNGRQHSCLSRKEIEKYFTKDKPVVFAYHGYINDVEQILWPYVDSDRFALHGYREEGSTTTPFDMKVVNKVSFYHLALSMIERASVKNKKIGKRKAALTREIKKRLKAHHDYIVKHGDDPQDVKAMCWI